MHFTSSSCTRDFTMAMDKSLAVQTTAEGQTQPLWQGWRRKGGKGREWGGEREREIKIKMLIVILPRSHKSTCCHGN